ncbi:hypothetical protein IFM58399_09425 [Aspergillus lentulus]|uniref:uncharacterized protein n=1 Tax=Aspergillus lentulus TaxID=293939 RepID=UPI00139550D5|nr:uncharacterized protein IFM58399_09425 [Aspergillus lentulus]GFF52827.1 hypothetical protein IFM58399_09425 [Aspergillus lentulus]
MCTSFSTECLEALKALSRSVSRVFKNAAAPFGRRWWEQSAKQQQTECQAKRSGGRNVFEHHLFCLLPGRPGNVPCSSMGPARAGKVILLDCEL